MDIPKLPGRKYTLGKEPNPIKSISYHTDCTTLHHALEDALDHREYEALKESKLGVFIKFQELEFEPLGFSLIEFENLTGLNCEYIEDLESPYCPFTKEMSAFWEKLGVNIDAGPSTDQIIAALKRCKDWSRDDRKRLAYLAIFAGYIEGKKVTTSTRASLARLVIDLEQFENYPWGRVTFKVLIESLKAKNITGCYTIDGFVQAFQSWVYTALPELGAGYGNPIRVENFVEKEEIGELFPQWDSDVEDPDAENIIKVMYKRPWKWTMDCWEVTGTCDASPTKKDEERPRRRKKAEEHPRRRKKAEERPTPRPRKKPRLEATAEATAEASEEATSEEASEEGREEAREREEAPEEAREEVSHQGRSDVRTERKEDPKEDPKKRKEDQKEDPKEDQKEDQKEDPKEDASEVAKDDPKEDASEVANEGASSSKVSSLVVAEEVEEPSVLLLEKEKSTLSDKAKEIARYESKRDAAHLEL
ncbi:uncharacterized protein LOC108832548 [Raphanus sativus]|uniref:Uncharacterized protein LOC108832548 n=1 Tax=Raphanus sativus TaxID=3726 RepID=A0A9W3DEL4_RAPSA|nr:uncharacterized protein LOC108832548 [Raphanus sativus]